jgi:hypothetical protein
MGEHAIVDRAIAAIDWRGEVPLFLDGGRDALASDLRAHFGKPDLKAAVRALLLFAFFLHEKKADAASKAVVDVVQTARTALAAAEVHLSDVVAEAANAAASKRAIGANAGTAIPLAAAAADGNGMKWWQVVAKGDR